MDAESLETEGRGRRTTNRPREWFKRLRTPGNPAPYLGVTLVLVLAAGLQVSYQYFRSGPLGSRAEVLGLDAVLAVIGVVTLLALLGTERFARWSAGVALIVRRVGGLAWPTWAVLIALFPLMVFGPLGRFLEPLFVRALGLWLLAVFAAAAVEGRWAGHGFDYRLAGTLLAAGVLHRLLSFVPDLSTYPLALGWSETSRYYYASLFLADRIYGAAAPLSVLHPSRYLLQAVPFLLPHSALWLHRLWQVVLWLGLTGTASVALLRRQRLAGLPIRWPAVLWSVLFIFQGPILYHLLVPVIIVLLAFDRHSPWRSLGAIVLASAWAGISRINWIPVPGFLAATLYLLERERAGGSGWRYLARPTIGILVGSLIGLATYSGYVLASGNAVAQFGSSFASDLLWYRLLPNPTFPPGILLAVALAGLPPAIVVCSWIRAQRDSLDPLRWLPLAAMLLVLLVGGTVVSLKIGGGSNLHNMDAYLVLLIVVATSMYFGRVLPSQPGVRPTWLLVAAGIAIPLFFNLAIGGPWNRPDPGPAQQTISRLQDVISEISGSGPQVLFISERHLLTFGAVGRLPLIPDYEKVFLMEMAMSGSRAYLDQFRARLKAQEFALIVSEPLKVQYQGRGRAFGEENDAWVREVSVPVLCYYEPVWTAAGVPVQVLAPRPDPVPCPSVADGE